MYPDPLYFDDTSVRIFIKCFKFTRPKLAVETPVIHTESNGSVLSLIVNDTPLKWNNMLQNKSVLLDKKSIFMHR